MRAYVIDASIAVKWIVDEPGTTDALALRIALAAATDCFVTADERLLRKLAQAGRSEWRDKVISLRAAAAS